MNLNGFEAEKSGGGWVIDGNVFVDKQEIAKLPKNLLIRGCLFAHRCETQDLPEGLIVTRTIHLYNGTVKTKTGYHRNGTWFFADGIAGKVKGEHDGIHEIEVGGDTFYMGQDKGSLWYKCGSLDEAKGYIDPSRKSIPYDNLIEQLQYLKSVNASMGITDEGKLCAFHHDDDISIGMGTVLIPMGWDKHCIGVYVRNININ